jgi:hypothetical protein
VFSGTHPPDPEIKRVCHQSHDGSGLPCYDLLFESATTVPSLQSDMARLLDEEVPIISRHSTNAYHKVCALTRLRPRLAAGRPVVADRHGRHICGGPGRGAHPGAPAPGVAAVPDAHLAPGHGGRTLRRRGQPPTHPSHTIAQPASHSFAQDAEPALSPLLAHPLATPIPRTYTHTRHVIAAG